VPGDPAQPRDDIGASVEGGAAMDRCDERLLTEVLGQAHVVGAAAQNVRVDAREGASVLGLEGGIARERQLELVRRLRGPGASGPLPSPRSISTFPTP